MRPPKHDQSSQLESVPTISYTPIDISEENAIIAFKNYANSQQNQPLEGVLISGITLHNAFFVNITNFCLFFLFKTEILSTNLKLIPKKGL